MQPSRLGSLAIAITTLVATSASCAQRGEEPVGAERTRRPNIVLILADDLGYSDIAPYGSEIATPNLQRLAEEGLIFTDFYNQARCMPARGSLLTGLYPTQSGIGWVDSDSGLPGYTGDLAAHAVTMAEVLGAAGYGTYMSGKWHVTTHTGHWGRFPERQSKHNWPLQRGFDRFYGMILGASSFFDPVTLTEGNDPLPSPGPDYYFTDAVTDRATAYIEEHVARSPDDPFFLYVAYTAPHWPLHAPEPDVARQKGRYDDGWETLHAERVSRQAQLGLWGGAPVPPPEELVRPWADLGEREQRWYARAMEVYAAQVEIMDSGIGRLLSTLEDTGVDGDTLIVFLADNGACAEVLANSWNGLYVTRTTHDGQPVTVGNEHVDVLPGPETTFMSYGREWAWASNAPFRYYKHWTHEGGIATPLLVRWPAGTAGAGRMVREPGQLTDLMATFVDVANAEYPAQREGIAVLPMEGVSLAPTFTGVSLAERPLFFEHEGNRAVRLGRWKLVERFAGDGWQLHDLATDRAEALDVGAANPERVAQLVGLYEDWADRVGVLPWPLEEPGS